jgi:cytochrome c556
MSRSRRAAVVAIVAVVAAGLGGVVFAQDLIGQRVALMKGMATDLNQVRANAGATPPNMAAAKTTAQKVAASMKRFRTLFPPGTDSGAAKTRAKPEIWSDAAGWKAANDKALADANAMVAAAGGSDPNAVTDAVAAFQRNCTSCHAGYRGPAAQ